jgi:ABC-2 type transport system permease protein
VNASLLIARREVMGFFASSIGYVVMAAVLALHSVWYHVVVMNQTRTAFAALENHFFHSSGWVAIFAVLTSMRLFAEEDQMGTLVFLRTAPVTEGQLVAGKFLGGLFFLTVYLALTLLIPLSVVLSGEVSPGHVAVGYLGLLLLGGAVLAVGTLASSLTPNQLVAVILGLVATGALFLCWYLAKKVEGPLGDFVGYLDLMDRHYRSFSRGVLKTSTVVYFLSLTYAALLGATAVLVGRRWRG